MNMYVYYDSSWAILSTIGLATFFFSILVVGITRLSLLSIVPIAVSASCAIANGLSYYAQYENTEPTTSATAWAAADILWMIQEAGLSFYSYAIVTRILRHREWLIYVVLFWILMLCILVARTVLLIYRAKSILRNDSTLSSIVNAAHIAYFVSLALVECLGAFFLLRAFATAKKSSEQVSLKTDLFNHLMRSTEVRLAVLALIGVARAVTFFFEPPVQGGSSISIQVDTFLYSLECMFPVMLIIDMLASKVIYTQRSQNEPYHLSNRRQSKPERLHSISRRRELVQPRWVDEEMPERGNITTTAHEHHQSSGGDETSLSGTSQTGIMKTVGITIQTSN